VAGGSQFCFRPPALLESDVGKRAAADQRVAVLNLLHDLRRNGTAADNVAKIFGNLLHGLRGSVGEK
jgi:hypothetical protein